MWQNWCNSCSQNEYVCVWQRELFHSMLEQRVDVLDKFTIKMLFNKCVMQQELMYSLMITQYGPNSFRKYYCE